MGPRTVLCVVLSGFALAEPARLVEAADEAAPPTVQVLVDEVTDKRTTGTFFAECEIELKVMGDAVADALGIRAIRVLNAVDETGRQLKSEKEHGSLFFSPNTEKQSLVKQKVTLKNPARSAKTIQALDGEVELFHPTAENGGVVTVRGFMSTPGQPLAADALKAWNVKVMYVTKELLEAKKRELAEQQKQASDVAKAGQEFGEAFSQLLSGMFGGLASEGPSLQFLVDDPDKRLVDLAFLDAGGHPLKTNGRMSMGEVRTFSFKEAPPPETQLVLYLSTPASLTVVPFKLRDIPLP